MGDCQWRGYRGVGISCIQGCADGTCKANPTWNKVPDTGTGETEVVTDTSVYDGKKVSHAEN